MYLSSWKSDCWRAYFTAVPRFVSGPPKILDPLGFALGISVRYGKVYGPFGGCGGTMNSSGVMQGACGGFGDVAAARSEEWK